MKILTKIAATLFLIFSCLSIALADDSDFYCNQGKACKKLCALEKSGKFDYGNEKHRDLIVQCSISMSKNPAFDPSNQMNSN